MGLMMLAAAKGTDLKFECEQNVASEFESEMKELFASKFQDE
jgi:phosphotransferase system HPr-like phosphotransfer protein